MRTLRIAVFSAMLLSLIVVMLGAYTRITDAGLGCPDWPGCYGHMILPIHKLENTQTIPAKISINARKAWTEMAHRYVAGTLVLMVILITYKLLRTSLISTLLTWTLLLLLGLQALLGMWTVTLKLLPLVVMGHLLGGILIFTCLSYLCCQLSAIERIYLPGWHRILQLGFLIVFLQIALGGWVSSNYAGLACTGFPLCNGQWISHIDFTKGFQLFSTLGLSYQGGILNSSSRIAINWVHRLGAFVTAIYVCIAVSIVAIQASTKFIRWAALSSIICLIMQFILGITNVIYLLPLWSTILHNGIATLLLALIASLCYATGLKTNKIMQGVTHAV